MNASRAMQKVYECLDRGTAENIKDSLCRNGIDAYLVDYSRQGSKSGIFGESISECPTVYIRDVSDLDKAKRIIFDKEVELFGAGDIKQVSDENERLSSPIMKQILIGVVVFLVVMLVALFANP